MFCCVFWRIVLFCNKLVMWSGGKLCCWVFSMFFGLCLWKLSFVSWKLLEVFVKVVNFFNVVLFFVVGNIYMYLLKFFCLICFLSWCSCDSLKWLFVLIVIMDVLGMLIFILIIDVVMRVWVFLVVKRYIVFCFCLFVILLWSRLIWKLVSFLFIRDLNVVLMLVELFFFFLLIKGVII